MNNPKPAIPPLKPPKPVQQPIEKSVVPKEAKLSRRPFEGVRKRVGRPKAQAAVVYAHVPEGAKPSRRPLAQAAVKRLLAKHAPEA